ncbi:hypothetical protein AYO44_13980 [Planctomycetaceae bacterium SCGC AG-212-F19]|nr:hypothetical protein AYO44_13980 [Planctomycetaceae bacterium SCGC AG-212-F19]
MSTAVRPLLALLFPGLVCLTTTGCGKDATAPNKGEIDSVKAHVQMNSPAGWADTTTFESYEGGWIEDAKGKARVVRCIMTQGKPPQKYDKLYRIEKNQAVDSAPNPAGDDWRTAGSKITWDSQKPKDEN